MNYIATKAVVEIEKILMTRLNIGFVPPRPGAKQPTQFRAGFDCNIAIHRGEGNRYRVGLQVMHEEMGEDELPMGRKVEAELLIFLAITDKKLNKDEMSRHALLNGIATLYGYLRGVVANATGSFPGSPLVLPSIMPQEIVDLVESNRQKNQPPPEENAAGSRNPEPSAVMPASI